MALPTNFSNLHLRLSRKIFDPVATANLDGKKITSALRSDYLNRANRFIQLFFVVKEKQEQYKPLMQKWLSGLVKTYPFSWLLEGTALPATYVHWIGCQHAQTTTRQSYIEPVEMISMIAGTNPDIKNAFTIFAGKILGYLNGASLTSGLGLLFYLSSDQTTATDGATDIAIDSLWYDALVDIAASYFKEDIGEFDMAKAQEQRHQIVLSVING